jgi:light-regulated signal transduction histidine kinase (bacteriophytochrome)
MEASLHDAIDELRKSNQELEQFAYVASHDLQEPLRMVASYTQLLARRYADKLDQDAQDFIGYAVDGATRMQQLIQDLLAYSRITTRGAPPEPVDVRGALDDAIRNLETAVAESGATVTADDLPTVLGDRAQLVQLLQNLIGNSIKFHRPEASPHVHVSARPDPDDDSRWAFLVADDGIGIDPKYADRVFVIFQRLHGREEYAGTGIGLALCKRIVERHGGAIWLQPDRTDGTTVSFTLPRVESGSTEEGGTDGRSD